MFRRRFLWRTTPLILLLGVLLGGSALPATAEPLREDAEASPTTALRSELAEVIHWLWTEVFGPGDDVPTSSSAPAEGDEGPGMTPDG